MVERVGLVNCNDKQIPMAEGTALTNLPDDEQPGSYPFRELTGAGHYLVTTRPDSAYALGVAYGRISEIFEELCLYSK
jgi:hypothetical protein